MGCQGAGWQRRRLVMAEEVRRPWMAKHRLSEWRGCRGNGGGCERGGGSDVHGCPGTKLGCSKRIGD
ncbi:hypothetical protein M0R45_016403 [Rubus argutus]|uniref:Uncharacterized protein n=1 Tax=Rubus argutus TaxID=59490 RepID=A0AAW1XSZ9_RUBAR